MIVLRFLPLDRVYYLVNDKVKEGYVMRVVILPNRFTIFDINDWIFDIDILGRDIIKLVKRQLPIGCEYHCKNCAVLKGLQFCGICPIRQKLILPNLGLKSNICGFGIDGLEVIHGEMYVELVFPKPNKHKDGTREGLLEVLDNQLEYNLWDHIIYKWSSPATGMVWLSYRELIEKLINTDSVPEELYKTSIPNEDFCGYCIFKGSGRCSNCYFSSLVLNKNKNYYE